MSSIVECSLAQNSTSHKKQGLIECTIRLKILYCIQMNFNNNKLRSCELLLSLLLPIRGSKILKFVIKTSRNVIEIKR